VIPLRSRILDVGVRALFHTLLLVSLFFLFRGHNQPGGGFAGGLVAGAAFVLLWMARRRDAVVTLRATPETFLGLGLLAAVTTALVPVIGSGRMLESASVTWSAPLGDVTVYSVLAFDIAVYLIVLGFVAVALRRLGNDGPDDVARS